MSAEVELISTIAEKKSWTRPPIQMEFQVPESFQLFFVNVHAQEHSVGLVRGGRIKDFTQCEISHCLRNCVHLV